MVTKVKRLFIDGDYGQIHLRAVRPTLPTKRPLLCLHMFPQSGRNFESFLNEADAERIVVAPDFPGYGESCSPPEQIAASDYARSIWQVVDTLGLLESHASVDMFGVHAGAKLATEVARQRPRDVNSMVLSSAAVLYPQELEQLKKAFYPVALDESGTRFTKLWKLLIHNQGPGQTLEMLSNHLAEILRSGEYYEWGHYAVYEFNQRFPDVLSSLNHPIALLNPKDDLYEMTPRTLEYLNNGKLYDYPNWGQGFIEVNAADVFKEVRMRLEQMEPVPKVDSKADWSN